MNASAYHIRLHCPADWPRLREITSEAFEGVSIDRAIEQTLATRCRLGWEQRKWRSIEEDLARQPDGVFVAEVARQVAGYVTTRVDSESGVGWIPNLAVDAVFRGQGIGRALLQHAVMFFRKRGLVQARIETLQQNPVGQKLYPSLGFQEVARQIHYCLDLAADP